MRRYFGKYGGQYAPEVLMRALEELENAYSTKGRSARFRRKLGYYLREYAGRPTPLYHAERLGRKYGLKKLYLKREDLLHTGAHKINNALGQALLAKEMGKARVIAETGAGQHGVATATACAMLGLKCEIYMGEKDMERQRHNVFCMEVLGANVIPVSSGGKTLTDAINDALRDYAASSESTHYLIGSVLGPHPYPTIVRDFQLVIGKEARRQVLAKEGRLPDYLVACVGGGSNSIGLFGAFLKDRAVRMIGVEGGGKGGMHAARFYGGRAGAIHGTMTYVLQDRFGQIADTHSVSAGLDYAAVGPEHSMLHDVGRVKYVKASDGEALRAFGELARAEGIIPALESAHAVAHVKKLARKIAADSIVIVNLSGRGDKDVQQVARIRGVEI